MAPPTCVTVRALLATQGGTAPARSTIEHGTLVAEPDDVQQLHSDVRELLAAAARQLAALGVGLLRDASGTGCAATPRDHP